MKQYLLTLNNVNYFQKSKYILKNINFNIKQNELVCIVGKNGSGKTTLCELLTNNLKPSSGSIVKTPNLKISYIPQIKNYNFIMPISVSNFLLLNNPNKNILSENANLLTLFNLNHCLNKTFKDLSGGEQQKAIILRSLLLKPNLLIMDEPESFIDFQSKTQIYSIINDIRKTFGISVVIVSHDVNLVLKDTNWVLCLNNGEIGCQGMPSNITKEDSFNKIFSNQWSYYEHKDLRR